jgi:hypothetical protein
MHPLLVDLARRFDQLATRDQILDAVSDLEAVYDSLDEIEQETVTRLIEELNLRLASIGG